MAVRLAFGLLLVLATALLYFPAITRALRQPDAFKWLQWLFVGSRVAGWLGTYVVLGELTRYSDLVLYYHSEAVLAVGGQLPYIDFPTSYGPLFPYVAGVGLLVWPERAAIALVMIAFEVASVLLFVRRAATVGGTQIETINKCLFVYLCSPAALYWSGMLAYNSSIVLFFWVLSISFLVRGSYAASLGLVGASIVVGKFLGVLVAPVWLAAGRRRVPVLALFGLGALVLTAWLRQQGVDLLLPLVREGGRSTSGNIWFLLSGLVALSADGVLWRYGPLSILALSLATLAAWLWSRWKQSPTVTEVCAAVAATGWLFMLLSKKSYPHYVPMFLLFFVFAVSAHRPQNPRWAVLLAMIGLVGILEPGIWNGLGQPQWLSAVEPSGRTALYYALIVADATMVGAGAYYLAVSARIAGRIHRA